MKTSLLVLLLAGAGTAARAQSVGVGTPTPNPAAALDVSSTRQGLLFPRMSQAQRDAIRANGLPGGPALGAAQAGLTIYNLSNGRPSYWDGSRWVDWLSDGPPLLGAATTYGFTGAPQAYTVPPGVTRVQVVAQGAAGGVGYNNGGADALGGIGGQVTAQVAVTPGQTLGVYVGGQGGGRGGQLVNGGGYNGGGAGFFGAGGGGASDVRQGGSALADRVVVASGGGGSGSSSNAAAVGGAGGQPTGATAPTNLLASPRYWGGGGATQASGGSGANAVNGSGGTAGTLGQGGTGNAATVASGGLPYSGGGGGYWGGGGGCWGGGGGGSSWAAGGAVSYAAGSAGDGSVTIAPILSTAPAPALNGANFINVPGTWDVNGPDLYHLGGNVGIGTPAPAATLHVGGAASTVRLEGLAGSGPRLVVADAAGALGTQPLASVADNLGNHLATQDLNLNGNQLAGGASNNVGLVAGHTLELGNGVSGKEASAGKIGYQRFSADALDLVGAGTTGSNRKIKLWAEGGTDLTGPLAVAGLAGSGTRLVTASPAGALGSAPLPTDAQTLAVSATSLSISGGNSVPLASLADDLGNHTATQKLDLGAFALVGNGGSQGLRIAANGHVGIGTASPSVPLDVAGAAEIAGTLTVGGLGAGPSQLTGSTAWSAGSTVGQSFTLDYTTVLTSLSVYYGGGATGNTLVQLYAGNGYGGTLQGSVSGVAIQASPAATTATFATPLTLAAGTYTLRLGNGLGALYSTANPYPGAANTLYNNVGQVSGSDLRFALGGTFGGALRLVGPAASLQADGLAGPGTRALVADASGVVGAAPAGGLLARLAAGQAGTATLGGSTSGLRAFTVTFPAAFAAAPGQVLCTVRGQNGTPVTDTFGATTYAITATGFTVNVLRLDVGNSWGQNLQLDWLALP